MAELFHISNILGLSLVLSILAGYLIHYLHIPKVTGYLILGILLGPFGMELLTHEDINQLRFVSEVALGLIVFSIGGEFKISRFRKIGHQILVISFLEIFLTLLGVFILVVWVEKNFTLALLLGVIGIATAPAATLLVLREFDSEGPVTHHVLILVGINNLFCLILFRLIFPLVKIVDSPTLGFSGQQAFFWPFFEVIGSLAIGFFLGLIVILGENRLQKKNEFLTLILATIVIGIGIGAFFNLSSLLINLALGSTVANLSGDYKNVVNQIKSVDLPFYIIFFLLAGASLHLDLLPSAGKIGFAYIVGRIVGKLLGIYLGARKIQAPKTVRLYGGLGMLAQAGIAIGICQIITKEDPLHGSIITSTVLSSVILFELLGPVLLRWAIIKSGEVKLINIIYKKGGFPLKDFIAARIRQIFGLFPLKVGQENGVLLVKHVMRTQVETIPEDAPFDQILKFIEHSQYNQFPVVNRHGNFIGLISFQEIRDSLYDESIRNLIIARDLAIPPKVTVSTDTALDQTLQKFTFKDVDFIPVIDIDNPKHLVGILTQRDVLAAFRRKSS